VLIVEIECKLRYLFTVFYLFRAVGSMQHNAEVAKARALRPATVKAEAKVLS